MPEFELVLPAYNEEKNLPHILEQAQRSFEKSKLASGQFQLVIVDNGSKDGTAHVLETLLKTHGTYFRVVTLEENRGYGGGLLAGLQSTTAPYVGWTHADRQCEIEDAFQAFQMVRRSESRILVKGTRRGRNWKDRLVTQAFEKCARVILGMQVKEVNAQPKVFQRSLLDKLQSPPSGFSFDLYILYHALKAGLDIRSIPVVFPPRIHGTSKWASNFFSRYRTILQVLKDMRSILFLEGRVGKS